MMFTMSEKRQSTAGIQNDQPYQPVPSRIGMATMPATRETVFETAFSSPKGKARPAAPNQW